MRHLASILLIILFAFSCQKSTDKSSDQMTDLAKRQTERLKHVPSIMPIQGGKIVNHFGQRAESLTNRGIDIAVEKEADVFAVAAGKAIDVKKGTTMEENMVIIDHGCGFQTKYSNLSEILVEANQSVKRWSVIGKMKKLTDQPALLHYEVIKDSENVDSEQDIF